MKTANKTTDFQMCPEINTQEEDGEKRKGEPLSTNLEFQRTMPGSEPTVITPLPCCSLMCIVPEQADFTEVLEGCGHFPDPNFDPRSHLLS